jgi:hypothetical protein
MDVAVREYFELRGDIHGIMKCANFKEEHLEIFRQHYPDVTEEQVQAAQKHFKVVRCRPRRLSLGEAAVLLVPPGATRRRMIRRANKVGWKTHLSSGETPNS